uniref:(3R)-3-hydroxyacyl-CoA dehydrogenase n=1 Tax=Amblyomma maculatum TaxID=34609 RepID=G3MQH9_AMBMU
MSLEGRLALVTGGTSGIGKAACHALAAEGATVVVASRHLDQANSVAQSLPGSASHRGAVVDVGNSESVEKLFTHVRETESLPLSIVVNSAGKILHVPFVETTEEDFDRIIRTNLKGTFLVARAAARTMSASGVADAVIVNVGSILGTTGGPLFGAYSASKAGVMALTKTLAQELAPQSIRCNVVLPALTRTPMGDSLPEECQKVCVTKTLLARMGEPEEVAQAILFLCSPKSSYMTGAALEVTGGFSI